MYTIGFLSHTADIRMTVEADSRAQIFEGALAGMAELIRKGFCTRKRNMETEQEIDIHSPDVTCLLVDFLNTALSQSQINKAIYCEIVIRDLTSTHLSAIIKGSREDEWDEDIKAVTYHEAELKMIGNRWTTRIIFDI